MSHAPMLLPARTTLRHSGPGSKKLNPFNMHILHPQSARDKSRGSGKLVTLVLLQIILRLYRPQVKYSSTQISLSANRPLDI
ncbi:hypothetical protein E2C01_010116 [Portunus trituberculatus]|uniref:Uncharacterized protein n=1 Tax=Portunus trituberculatus TaxID=210409 RepID=A0A5B7D7J4_PORTR|nr:hypothetical protein [Portunus trituberculatus]